MLNRALGPPSSVRTHPGAMSNSVLGSPAWRAAKLRMQVLGAVHLVPSGLVIGDAALTRGHHADRTGWSDQILEALDDAHGAQRIGHHHAHEFVRRYVRHRFPIVILDPGIHEQQVEQPASKTRMQRACLIRRVDIDNLDRQPSVRRRELVVKFRFGAAAYGRDEVASAPQILGGQRIAEAARGTDE